MIISFKKINIQQENSLNNALHSFQKEINKDEKLPFDMKCFKQKTFSIKLQMSYVVIQSKLLNVLQFKRKYMNM